jgi:hypothetical protein
MVLLGAVFVVGSHDDDDADADGGADGEDARAAYNNMEMLR